jgi:carboxyl-terminal processing protease
MPRLRTVALAGALALPLAFGGFLLAGRRGHDGAQMFDQVLGLVQDRFVDTLPSDALYEKAARGLVTQLRDPYSELFSPKQQARFKQQSTGKYGGVGMQIEQQEGNVVVVRVFPNTPAEAAGIVEGDRIIGIDTANTRGWTSQQVSDVMIGKVGTKVTVRFARPGMTAPIEHAFTRAEIHIPAVPYAVMLSHDIGYVPLQTFNETASDELQAAVDRLTQAGAKRIIVDLRSDPGGLLNQALSVASLFLENGKPIASVRTRQPTGETFTSKGSEHITNVPLVVLVDGFSASASEIVAGALQDDDRALLVGTRTTGKWYTPSARSIQQDRTRHLPGDEDVLPSDTAKKDTSLAARPKVKSASGRTLYGGGGITPDVIVLADTLTTAEQDFNKLIAPKFPLVRAALYDIALEQKASVSPGFTVPAAWRDQFFKRLVQDSIKLTRQQFDAVTPYIDRVIGAQVARVAFGDSGAFRRNIPGDAQLVRAIDLLQRAKTQQELFSLAPAAASAAKH